MNATNNIALLPAALIALATPAAAHSDGAPLTGALHDIAHLFGGADHFVGVVAFVAFTVALLTVARRRAASRRDRSDGGRP